LVKTTSGLVLADDAADRAAQAHPDLELTVLLHEEDEALHADGRAGGALLALADPGHLLLRHLRIPGALLAAGDHAVDHVRAALDPRRERSRAAEVHVVGVREDRHRALRHGECRVGHC
jgi:hypothetical protein